VEGRRGWFSRRSTLLICRKTPLVFLRLGELTLPTLVEGTSNLPFLNSRSPTQRVSAYLRGSIESIAAFPKCGRLYGRFHPFYLVSSNSTTLCSKELRWSQSKTERGDNRPFKLTLYTHYHDAAATSYPETLRCAALGIALPSTAVIAAHLYKHKFSQHIAKYLEIEKEGPRNGLLLYKPIKEAFDDLVCLSLLLQCHI
jgi:hypothetical protein